MLTHISTIKFSAALMPAFLLPSLAFAQQQVGQEVKASITASTFLQSTAPPSQCKSKRTMPLSRWGWNIPAAARIELATNWGFALEFDSYLTHGLLNSALGSPTSDAGLILAAAKSGQLPNGLSVNIDRNFDELSRDTNIWARDLNGMELRSARYEAVADKLARDGRQWSPLAPVNVFRNLAKKWFSPVERITRIAHVDIILNGGEYGLSYSGFSAPYLKRDIAIREAKGDKDWYEFLSQAKANQELPFFEKAKSVAPNRRAYVYYHTGSEIHRNRTRNWKSWAFDFTYLRSVSDYPSSSLYYQHENSGWNGENDLLTQALNAIGYQIKLGRPHSYNWVSGGWPRVSKPDSGLSDSESYTGFLKMLYTAGNIGAVAGYFAYPQDGFGSKFPKSTPPDWLLQIQALAHVHALWTYLAEFQYEGSLVPGLRNHRFSTDQPKFELKSSDKSSRILARKHANQDKWIVTAWRPQKSPKKIRIEISNSIHIEVEASSAGNTYFVHMDNEKLTTKSIDYGSMTPTSDPGFTHRMAVLLRSNCSSY